MRNVPSKLALAVGFLLAMVFTFSCSGGGGGNGNDPGGNGSGKNSCLTEFPSELLIYIRAAEDVLFWEIFSSGRAQLKPLSKPNSSGIAKTEGNAVVCKDVVEAKITEVKQGIAEVCAAEFEGSNQAACIHVCIRFAEDPPNPDDERYDPNKDDLTNARLQGRVLYILNRMLN